MTEGEFPYTFALSKEFHLEEVFLNLVKLASYGYGPTPCPSVEDLSAVKA